MSGPHICFVAPSIYPVLVGDTGIRTAGGAEVQQAIVIKALVRDGMRVSVICYSPGGSAVERVAGIELHTLPRPTGGVKGIRFIHPRLTAVARVVRRLEPDLVYNRAASAYVGGLAVGLMGTRSRLIYAAANDHDFLAGRHGLTLWPDTPIFRFGVRRAHMVLVQNARQLDLLRQSFGRQGQIIANAYEEPACASGSHDGRVLWVGTVKPSKSPERFIELARRIPTKQFVMVGGPGAAADAQQYYQSIERAASEVPNLEFRGFVPFESVGRHFDGSAVLVNTSDLEGFPNTFLQAWIRGIPTLSFVKPEATPGQTGTIACADLADMAERLKGLTASEGLWRQARAASLQHFERSHSIDRVLPLYRKVFEQVLQ